MADYPTVSHSDKSTRTPVSGTITDLSISGVPRGRQIHTSETYQIRAIHEYTVYADKEAVMTHYENHKSLTFYYFWPDGNVRHTAVYQEPPNLVWKPGGWDIEVSLLARKG
jgi:hypothetical protein